MENNPKQETETPIGREVERQTRNLGLSREGVEASIWTKNMLTALDNGVKGGKWFSLIDKVYRPRTLNTAWEHVRSNRGAAGVDKITIERFDANASKYLQEISDQLKDGTYKPQAVKRVEINQDGKIRPLGIPTVKDRIVQMAIKMTIEPIFEKEFLSSSFGFRPGRGCRDALRQVEVHLKENKIWVLDADLKSYFDTIPHGLLMKRVEERIADTRILNLINAFLKQEVMKGCDSWIPTQGTPQGAVLSPLLANIYLHSFDILMNEAGYAIVRYADDFVVMCQTEQEAKDAFEIVNQWVQTNGLTIHPDKTHLGNCQIRGQGFDFLGYRFENNIRMVRKKSIKKFRDNVRSKTKRTCGKSIKDVILDLNRMLKGWFAYFKWAHPFIFKWMDGFIRRRLRAILRKQNKRPGFGHTIADHKRWPNSFFAKLGLFSLVKAREQWVASQSR